MKLLRLSRDERGVTLPDVLVGLTLTMIITSLLVAGTMMVHRAQRYSSKDSDNLSTLRVSLDRLEKEVRQARKIYEDSTATRVRLWVDSDRDYQQDLAEHVVWELVDVDGAGPLQVAQLVRYTDSNPAQRIAGRNLIFGDAFFYNNEAPYGVEATTLMSVTLKVETPGGRAPQRLSRTSIRLRNASPAVNVVTGGGWVETTGGHSDIDEEDASDG